MAYTTLHHGFQTARSPSVVAVLRERLADIQQFSASLLAQFRQPAEPARTTRSLEAERVRTLASTYASSDPGFADDLYAAANRHEIGDDA